MAIAATGEALKLALILSDCVAQQVTPKKKEEFAQEVMNAHLAAATLEQAIDNLLAALPSNASIYTGSLKKHFGFIKYYLNRNDPSQCAQDPIDIVRGDLPGILKQFDRWYASQSALDCELSTRLMPYITSGQLNAAVREAWPIFKMRMVKQFGISDGIDGHKLVTALFGSNGATAGLLSAIEREGYLNLFKGLYTLSRNPPSHNDILPNPAEVDAVLTLLSSTLTKLEKLTAEGCHLETESMLEEDKV